MGLIPGSGKSPGEGKGYPLQYSCLGNPMDRGAWWAAVHGVTKSHTWLRDFTFTFHFHALEKEMATHSSVLAWRIPGMGEPAGLPSMGSHRVGHDWSDLAESRAEHAKVLYIYPKICLQVNSTSWLRTYLTNQYVILRYCSSNLYKWNYLYDTLPFYKIQVNHFMIQVNHFMAQDEPFGDKIIPKCILWVRGLVPFWVLRHSFLSDC